MNDLIERQAAIERLEHLSACGEPFVEIGTDDETFIGKYEAITEISDLPSAQPQIIHCKDCIWYELPSHKITENCVRWMKSNGILLPIKPDDFCSRAERRTDETD